MTRPVKRDGAHWGRPGARAPRIADVGLALDGERLPFGAGRSYGDVCRCDDGTLLVAATPPSLSLDAETGILTADAHATLGDVLHHLAGTGWFPPVLPGTRHVTLGGALANDVHGKNHHRRGTFGAHVVSLDLRRSDGTLLACSPDENADIFAATIGGMGLTGRVERLRLRLMTVASPRIDQTILPFESLAGFERVEATHAGNHEYAVAWLDSLGREATGHLIVGDHAREAGPVPRWSDARLSIPLTPPVPLLAGPPLRAFNWAYARANRNRGSSTVDPAAFFFPLDAIDRWNRLYGPRGLHQHQSVVPDLAIVERLLRTCRAAGQGSFLTVLKRFANRPSPALLSFPREGWTLTLDVADRGARTADLITRLDAIVLEAGGGLNAYKARAMPGETFRAAYPDWHALEARRDPAFMSDLWKRVLGRQRVDAPPLAINQFSEGDVQPVRETNQATAKPEDVKT